MVSSASAAPRGIDRHVAPLTHEVRGATDGGTQVRRTLVAGVAVVAAISVAMTGIATASSQGNTVTVTLSGITFNGKANSTAKAKVGDKLKFVWKNGDHNVVSTGLPAGVKKVSSGAPKVGHAPFTVSLTKKGTYSFECQPHQALGMKIKVTVT
jgi:plastocyanin